MLRIHSGCDIESLTKKKVLRFRNFMPHYEITYLTFLAFLELHEVVGTGACEK